MRRILPNHVLQRLEILCPPPVSESAGHRIKPGVRVRAELQDWAAYLNGQQLTRPKRPPWAEQVGSSPSCNYTLYDSFYGYVTDLFKGVARASSDVTFGGVSFSVSVVEGRDQFLAALQNGAAPRARQTTPSSVEVRLFTKEPGAHWYIIDKNREPEGVTFVYQRLARSLAGPALYAQNADSSLMRDFRKRADGLWADAAPWPAWQTQYEQWVQAAVTDEEHPLRG